MLNERYLVGRGYIAKLSLDELDEVESWYKQLGFKHSAMIPEMIADLRKLRRVPRPEGSPAIVNI